MAIFLDYSIVTLLIRWFFFFFFQKPRSCGRYYFRLSSRRLNTRNIRDSERFNGLRCFDACIIVDRTLIEWQWINTSSVARIIVIVASIIVDVVVIVIACVISNLDCHRRSYRKQYSCWVSYLILNIIYCHQYLLYIEIESDPVVIYDHPCSITRTAGWETR